MIERDVVEKMLMSLPDVVLDYPFGPDVAVYRLGSSDGKMFALMPVSAEPTRISLKCDPSLAVLLREKYETVLPGYHLNKRHWNTIICSGQLPEDELRDLVRHSYELAKV